MSIPFVRGSSVPLRTEVCIDCPATEYGRRSETQTLIEQRRAVETLAHLYDALALLDAREAAADDPLRLHVEAARRAIAPTPGGPDA